MLGRRGAGPPAVLAFMVGLVLSVTMLATSMPAAAAASHACRVSNLERGISVGSLQRAVRAASKGDRLVVRGTCRSSTWIGKDLHIRGVRSSTVGRPVLDGAGTGTVLKIGAKASVTLRDLIVRHGAASRGGGIRNRGTLVLRDVVVRANTSGEGGGIYNDARATLRLRGSSVVRGNTAAEWGGGISDLGTLVVTDSSTIRGNSSDINGGGVAVFSMGTMVMKGSSSITGNTAAGASAFTAIGGGISTNGTVTMRDSSVISGNTAARLGGGVHVDPQGGLVMRDASSIHDNEAIDGGGVFAFGGSLDGLRMPPDANPNVYDNIPDDCHATEETYGEVPVGDIACSGLASHPGDSASQRIGLASSSISRGMRTKVE